LTDSAPPPPDAAATSPEPPVLQVRGLSKRFGAVVANAGVDLTILRGEIHALLGENGAGKSTLVKAIYGVVAPDAGSIAWEGSEVTIPDPNAARRLGIGMVFQHFSQFETLTVAENIALGLGGVERPAALAPRIRETAARYGLAVDPERHVFHLSVGERQRVEILRCLMQAPKLLILDEPTSVLTPQEAQALCAVLRRLAAGGCAILYIGHKLEEIRALCHTATVLRAGRVAGSCDPRRVTPMELATLMVGSEPVEARRRAHAPGDVILGVGDLTLEPDDPHGMRLTDIRFELRAGEILGIAGVAGNGQKELLAALSGERRSAPGAIRLGGKPIGGLGPVARRREGLGFIPEERLGRGAVGELSLAENGILTHLSAPVVGFGLVRPSAARALARRLIERFAVRAAGVGAPAASLSGGNMQKFIVGRELDARPLVLVAAHPTWGVDVGATVAIRQALLDLAQAGAGIVVVSEDLSELFEIADRIAVLSSGRLGEAVAVSQLTLEAVGLRMAGQGEAETPRAA
jgi:simple sugar transport system ATP-binding protein